MGRGVGSIFRRQTFCPDTCPPSASQLSHENVTSASSLAGRGDGPARASQPHARPRSWALQGEDVGYGGRQGGGRKVPVPRVSCAVRRPPWAHESDTCPAWHWPLESHMPRPPVLATCEGPSPVPCGLSGQLAGPRARTCCEMPRGMGFAKSHGVLSTRVPGTPSSWGLCQK